MSIKITSGFIPFLLAFFTACQQNTPPVANQTARTPATNSVNVPTNNSVAATTSPTVAANASDQTKVKTFDAKGTVTKINLELGSVGLDHEEIKGLMPAMQGMEFYVSDKKLLDGLKVGDRVDFVLENNAGAEQIIRIIKSK